jgi:hypothetical protein
MSILSTAFPAYFTRTNRARVQAPRRRPWQHVADAFRRERQWAAGEIVTHSAGDQWSDAIERQLARLD